MKFESKLKEILSEEKKCKKIKSRIVPSQIMYGPPQYSMINPLKEVLKCGNEYKLGMGMKRGWFDDETGKEGPEFWSIQYTISKKEFDELEKTGYVELSPKAFQFKKNKEILAISNRWALYDEDEYSPKAHALFAKEFSWYEEEARKNMEKRKEKEKKRK